MVKTFQNLVNILETLDNDVSISVRVLNSPDSKIPLIYDILDGVPPSNMEFWHPERPREIKKYEYYFERMEQQRHEVAWACHDCHFHPDVYEYISCPFTSLTELVDLAQKTAKEWPNV